MEIKTKLKNWAIKQLKENLCKWITWLATFLGLGTAWNIFKTWLKADQTFTLAGWLWVFIFVITAAVPVLIFMTVDAIRKKIETTKIVESQSHLLSDPEDVVPILCNWLRKPGRSWMPNNELIVRYTEIDKQCGFEPGVSKAILQDMQNDFITDDRLVMLWTGPKTVIFIGPGHDSW